MSRWQVTVGDCVEVMRGLPDGSVDAVVCDPPYGLEFMGKDWDSPWKGKAAKEFNDIEPGTLGGFSRLPNHSRVNNVKCLDCDKWKFSSNPCACERPRFPDARGQSMRAFQEWCEVWAVEVLRVLKPGGHLLAFGGTRTFHRMTVAIEDAGFEVRDCLSWLYGSGFPKSLNVGKAIDKTNGEGDRRYRFTAWMRTTGVTAKQLNEVTGTNMGGHYLTGASQPAIPTADLWALIRPLCGEVPEWVDELVRRIEAEREVVGTKPSTELAVAPGEGRERPRIDLDVTAPATEEASRWEGWGTALKPAWEPVVLARKPLVGTVAGNVLAHGTGALNIDGSRIAGQPPSVPQPEFGRADGVYGFGAGEGRNGEMSQASGRWPANVLLDEVAAGMLDEQSGPAGSNSKSPGTLASSTVFGGWGRQGGTTHDTRAAGGASRFFYVAKASRRDRNEGLDGMEPRRESHRVRDDLPGGDNPRNRSNQAKVNHHPTVKPTALMRHLVRLITPPDGLILDPFCGSGSTGKAAMLEGFRFHGIEQDADYAEIARRRIGWAADHQDPQGTLL